MSEVLAGIQRWYDERCNGEWEHQFGISIETLDNPGWSVRIDLAGTLLAERRLSREEVHRSELDWWHRWAEDGRYQAACGPSNLEEVLSDFLAWSQQ